jgi:ribosomal protein S18 acetylase RimI-like enzyme
MMEISLRAFRFENDYPAVIDLWDRCGPGVQVRKSDDPEEIQKKLTRDPDLFIVAECESRIIGTVLGGFDGRRGMIYHLAVEPAFRVHGVGGKLMQEVESRLHQKGCLKAYLLVTNDNEEVIPFYEKRDWQEMHLHIFGKNLS